jgi:hypothetical protein
MAANNYLNSLGENKSIEIGDYLRLNTSTFSQVFKVIDI